MSTQERTEKATPKKQQDMRKKGQVSKSQDLLAAFSLLGMVAVVSMMGQRSIHLMAGFVATHLGSFELAPLESQTALTGWLAEVFVKIVGPILGAALVLGLVGNLVQTGFIFSAEPLKPKLSNLNPVAGIKRMFSVKSLVNTIKTLLKFVVISAGAWFALVPELEMLFRSSYNDIWGMYLTVSKVVGAAAFRIALLYFVIGFLDYLYQRYDFTKQARMTKQEVKQEFKEMEGDPLLRGKLKEKRRQLAAGRMMEKVPEATMVITNPTHYAVALEYRYQEMAAPVVVAKGTNAVAKRIVDLARKNNVPCFERPEVARALFATTEIGSEIPVGMYQFVAELLAIIYAGKGGGENL